MNIEDLDLEQACAAWEHWKNQESQAKEQRYAVEERIADLAGRKEEGSATKNIGAFKVKLTFGVSRTLDKKKWAEVKESLPASIAANIVSYSPRLVVKGYRWIEENDPASFAKINKCITSKPKKVGVSITRK